MQRHYAGAMALVVCAGLIGTTLAQAPAPGDGAGWTAITAPDEVIEARRGLMDELERLIMPIDSFTVGEPADAAQLQSAAQTISRMLLAVPHLFPPTTNLYDPSVLEPPTNALPAVWVDFGTFFELSDAAEAAASAMASMSAEEPLRNAARSLRASCDACHALYLKAYVPPTVTQEDLEFDFGTFFELSEAAEAAATAMASMSAEEPLRNAARSLRASCDACHALYLKAYVPPKVTQEDVEFDFESVLPKD